jgi:hypothetical protein
MRRLFSQLACAFQSHGDAEHGKAVCEVGGAVERIDVPTVLGSRLVRSALLGHDGVGGEARSQPFDDQPVTGKIGLGYQVELALQAEADPPFEVAHRQAGGLPCNLLSDVEVGVHPSGGR